MSILTGILIGLITGFLASKVAGAGGKRVVVDMALGAVGAFGGSAVFHLVARTWVGDFHVWSLVVSVIGALVVLAGYRATVKLSKQPKASAPAGS